MEPWIQLWTDPVAGIRASSACICLGDLKGDGDYNLIIADLRKKLRVYQGNHINWESVLLDIPTSVAIHYPDTSGIASLAIASGPFIFIYRNARPYFKFTLPSIDLDNQELRIWESLKEASLGPEDAMNELNTLRERGINLSARSYDLLAIDKADAMLEYIETHKNSALSQSTTITCMTSIKKDLDEDKAVSLLVLGTEHKYIIVLDSSGSSILRKIQIPAVPAILVAFGLYQVEYRIIIGCRDGRIYNIKNGELLATIIELENPPCGLVRVDRNVYVGALDKKIHCYHMKGRKLFTIYLNDTIACMELMSLTKTRYFKGLLVGLNNGEVRLYKDKQLLHSFSVNENIQGMCFGTFARDEGALVINLRGGGIILKLLDKRVNLDGRSAQSGPPPEQEVPLKIPRKTRLYVEQMDREKEYSRAMYTSYLKDLCSLRLRVAQSYQRLQQIEPATHSTGQLKLNAFVQGLGPLFTIILEVSCAGNTGVSDVSVCFAYNPKLFRILTVLPYLPLIVPSLKYKQEISVLSLEEAGDSIRIYLGCKDSTLPLISAQIQMPSCEQD
jgi:Bardet-Biedl syndrome 1 protein